VRGRGHAGVQLLPYHAFWFLCVYGYLYCAHILLRLPPSLFALLRHGLYSSRLLLLPALFFACLPASTKAFLLLLRTSPLFPSASCRRKVPLLFIPFPACIHTPTHVPSCMLSSPSLYNHFLLPLVVLQEEIPASLPAIPSAFGCSYAYLFLSFFSLCWDGFFLSLRLRAITGKAFSPADHIWRLCAAAWEKGGVVPCPAMELWLEGLLPRADSCAATCLAHTACCIPCKHLSVLHLFTCLLLQNCYFWDSVPPAFLFSASSLSLLTLLSLLCLSPCTIVCLLKLKQPSSAFLAVLAFSLLLG